MPANYYAGALGRTYTYTSVYPPAYNDTYVKATSFWDTGGLFNCYHTTNPGLSLTGTWNGQQWLTNVAVVNQRLHIDLGSAIIIGRIYYENTHTDSGDGYYDAGVQDFIFQGSNTGAGTFDDLVYANDEGWTTLVTSQSAFDQHVAVDQADPRYITVINETAYRYYGFKFANNWGDGVYMGVRRIELQTVT